MLEVACVTLEKLPQASKSRCCQAPSALFEPAEAVEIKIKLSQALQGVNRGIFGIQVLLDKWQMTLCAGTVIVSAGVYAQALKQTSILELLTDLEKLTTEPAPAQHLQAVQGCWRLLFSTIKIQVKACCPSLNPERADTLIEVLEHCINSCPMISAGSQKDQTRAQRSGFAWGFSSDH